MFVPLPSPYPPPQACDWRERPLSPDKLVYARCDSHYLIPLWRLLRARLLAADTFSNREDAREEEELREIKRGLDADQQRKEEAARQRHFPSAALAPVGEILSDKPATRSGASSPSSSQLAQEPRTSEWDIPEDCHRRERSRSGSLFRPDLESIHETANAVGAAATAGGHSLESALAAAFQEDDGDDDDNGGDDDQEGNAGLHHHHHANLGENLMDEGETEEEQDEQELEEPCEEEDEDEDLWEGWGEDASGGDNGGGTVAADEDNEHSLLGEEEEASSAAAVPSPLSHSKTSNGWEEGTSGTGAIEDSQGSTGENETGAEAAAAVPLPSSPSTTHVIAPLESPVWNGAASKGDNARGRSEGLRPNASRGGGGGAGAAVREPEVVVLTDGVRLVWRALSRTQTATALLWRPGPEAKRRDSHNERHFRTAVQRLKPPRWTEVNVRVYEEIFLWRDRTARRMDDGAAYVCPGDILIDVALAMPTTLDALRRVSAPLSPVLGHADTAEAAELVTVVRVALDLPAEEEEEEEGAATDGRKSGGIASRDVAFDGGGCCDGGSFGGAQGGVAFSTKSLALTAAVTVSLGIAIALSKRR